MWFAAGRQLVALGDLQLIGVMVARAIEPGLIVVAGHLDHQRVAVPLAIGPAHPAVHRRLLVVDHVDDAV